MDSIEIKLTKKVKLNTVIWKYLSFSSFVSLLINKSLVFRRVDLFADKLEGILCESAKNQHLNNLKKITNENEALQIHNNELKNIENHKKFTYANCWSISKNESYALWKIYLNMEKNGLAIKTTIQDLKNSINFCSKDLKVNEPIIFKEVSYTEYGIKDLSQDTVISRKNPEYKYENELRLIIKNQRNFNNPKEIISKGYNDKPVLYINVNINTLINELYISPFANAWFKDCVIKLLSVKEFDFNMNKLCISNINE